MIKIRKGNLKDIPRIAELLHEYDIYENKLDKRHQIDKIKDIISFNKKVMKSPNVIYFVLEINGKVEGIISADWRKTPYGKQGVFHNIIVSEKFRNKGYGTKLLLETEKYLKSKECEFIKSFVFINNKKSAKLYKKLGYSFEEGYSIKKKLK